MRPCGLPLAMRFPRVTETSVGYQTVPSCMAKRQSPMCRKLPLYTVIRKETDLAHQLNIIIASTRPGRVGPVFGRWLTDFAREHGKFEPVLVDLADFDLPLFDEPKHPRLGQYEKDHTKAWSASVSAADAFVFVTPEYNYFAPPALVNAISFLSREWQYKPAGFLSYGGISGGLRAVQAEKQMLTTLKVVPIPESVPLPNYPQFLNEDGAFVPTEIVNNGTTTMLDELFRWSEALKPMRGA